METIAFYSYKGGVGRSLLVANAARFLGMLGKRVVALDLDLEAPGLHYKFGRIPDAHSKPAIPGGAVPYIVTAFKGNKPPSLKEHTVELPLPEDSGGSLWLMPAGPAPRREYWAALKTLREKLRFDDPSGKGVAALLDLHAHIQDELKPDFLLIDARTGVTEIGGLATTALADCVVCMTVPNQESLDGTLAIVEALVEPANHPKGKELRVVPVVTRTTDDLEGQGKIAESIQRLASLAAVRVDEGKKTATPFIFPHDSAFGAADRIVGGDQNASAFSPLHKAYLELFQHLFPHTKKEAEDALRRLEAVSEVKERLIQGRRRRDGYRDSFDPWESSAIQEGVVFKEGKSKPGRYVDLVCSSENGKPLMVVEYVWEGQDVAALAFWKEHRTVRYVLLLIRSGTSCSRSAFCRADGWEKFEKSERWELPAPIEFEIFENPGIRTVDQLIEALHRGSGNIVPELVGEWQESMSAFGGFPHRKMGHWRPIEARKILDGLAATEKVEIGAKILRRASGSDWRHRRRNDDFEESGHSISRITEEDLFAPLFWRLPVEAVFKYLSEAEHPGWTPSFAGQQLLAGEIMGLRYDPIRSALQEANTVASRLTGDSDEHDDEERAMYRIHRRFHRGGNAHLSDETPPCVLWEQQLREDRFWSGDKEQIGDKARETSKKLMSETTRLRSWVRGIISRDGLVTTGLMGCYDAQAGRVELYSRILDALAPVLGIQPRYLKGVVFMQLSVFAVAHQSQDCDGQPGFGFAVPTAGNPFQRENPTAVILSQYFTFRLIERLGDTNLMSAFEKLSEKQPEYYRRWQNMRQVPVEQMRTTLLQARHNPSSLHL